MVGKNTKKMAIIATKGTLDWAYPPFILASTAAALGYEVQIFFTFYGLQLLKKSPISRLVRSAIPACRCRWAWTSGSPVLGTAIPRHGSDDDDDDEKAR